jgi:hypothetical protein
MIFYNSSKFNSQACNESSFYYMYKNTNKINVLNLDTGKSNILSQKQDSLEAIAVTYKKPSI